MLAQPQWRGSGRREAHQLTNAGTFLARLVCYAGPLLRRPRLLAVLGLGKFRGGHSSSMAVTQKIYTRAVLAHTKKSGRPHSHPKRSNPQRPTPATHTHPPTAQRPQPEQLHPQPAQHGQKATDQSETKPTAADRQDRETTGLTGHRSNSIRESIATGCHDGYSLLIKGSSQRVTTRKL